MRVPSVQSHPRSMRASTQPSTPRSPGGSTGSQGTPGGKARRKPGANGRRMILGQEVYLWILVVVEVALIGGFRKFFRRYHGG